MFVLYNCFQVISLEGWVDIMYMVQDAHSFWDWLYFVSLIVVSKPSQPIITHSSCSHFNGFCLRLILYTGDKPSWLGQYNVLRTRCPLLLGLDLFCIPHCGKLVAPPTCDW